MKSALFVFFFFLWEGIITAAVGQPIFLGKQIASVLILGCVALFPLAFLMWRSPARASMAWIATPVLLFIYCTFVSWISNTGIFHYNLGNWVLALYSIVPILFFFPLIYLSFTSREIISGLKMVGWLAALFLTVDYFAHFQFMEEFYRLSVFSLDSRRIVILKNEIVLSILLSMAELLSSHKASGRFLAIIFPLSCSLFSLVVIMESRLALLATALGGLSMIWLGRLASARALAMYCLGASALLPLLFVAIDKYTTGLGSVDYVQRYNISIRLDSFQYYWTHFLRSGGLGFGIMSTGDNASNLIATGIRQTFNVADLGLAGAAFQFGIIGLIIVFWMTLRLAVTFIRARRAAVPFKFEILAAGCFLLGFTLSPVPVNFFTASWTAMLGSTLWYLGYRWELEAALGTLRKAPPSEPGTMHDWEMSPRRTIAT